MRKVGERLVSSAADGRKGGGIAEEQTQWTSNVYVPPEEDIHAAVVSFLVCFLRASSILFLNTVLSSELWGLWSYGGSYLECSCNAIAKSLFSHSISRSPEDESPSTLFPQVGFRLFSLSVPHTIVFFHGHPNILT
jgi:hypothetical protein